MAPKRRAAAAPAPPILDGCTIALSGKFGTSHASLEAQIKTEGGAVTRSITKATTHLVCTETDFKEQSAKVLSAKANDLHLLNPDWLFESIKQKKKLAEKDYSWTSQTTNGGDATTDDAKDDEQKPNGTRSSRSRSKTSKANGTVNGDDDTSASTKKRPIAVAKSDGDEDDEPKTKKRGAAASKNTKASKKDEVKEETKDVPMKEPEASEDDKVVAEGQFVKKKGVVIPLDENCPLNNYQVYVDPDTGMIYDAALNQSNSGKNNNKFYRLQVLVEPKSKDFKTWTRWGRVGENGQSAILGNGDCKDAIKNFEKKFKDKSGHPWEARDKDPKPGKYAFVERNYNPDDSDDEDAGDSKAAKKEDEGEDDTPAPECKLEKPIMELMELIFNQKYFQQAMTALNYDANKMPLGRLSKTTILRGFQQLKDLAALFDDNSLARTKWDMTVPNATQHLSNTYYSLIPHDFGRNCPPTINQAMLKKEVELLESLSDMKDAADLMKIDRKARSTTHPLDSHFANLDLAEMTTLDHKSTEFENLAAYLNGSKGATHNVNYKIDQIFRIERNGEAERFEKSEYSKIASDRRLLWHGSRCTNFGGILSQGLRIAPPEAPVSGYMFGKGIYLADVSSKSAGYCASYDSNGYALLLLCEAELGDPMQKLTRSSYEAGTTAKKGGMHSTWGQGRMGPSQWMDAGAVHESLKGIKMPDINHAPGDTDVKNASLYYNEYIVYDVAQVKLRYLFRVKM